MREVFYDSLYLALGMLEYPVRLSDIKSGKIAKNYHLLVRKLGLNPPPISPEKLDSHTPRVSTLKGKPLVWRSP